MTNTNSLFIITQIEFQGLMLSEINQEKDKQTILVLLYSI